MNKHSDGAGGTELYEAVLSLNTVEECVRFFRDLCTLAEISAMEQRYNVARLLDTGHVYSDILEKTGASSATISRVNRSLRHGEDGYKIVFDRLSDNKISAFLSADEHE